MLTLPFTAGQLLDVLAQYNQAVWPMQLVLNGVGLVCLGLLLAQPAWASRMISLLLVGLWLWTAIAFHLAFFAVLDRSAWWFGIVFLLGAMAFDWFGVVNDRLTFHASNGGWFVAGIVLLTFALVIYPALSYALNHRYPATATFGSPCPITIFTIGLLLCAEAPAPRAVFAAPILWSVLGVLMAMWLSMFEDLSLLVAGLAAALFLYGPTRLALRSDAPHAVRP
jgi:hypothetical protein